MINMPNTQISPLTPTCAPFSVFSGKFFFSYRERSMQIRGVSPTSRRQTKDFVKLILRTVIFHTMIETHEQLPNRCYTYYREGFSLYSNLEMIKKTFIQFGIIMTQKKFCRQFFFNFSKLNVLF